MIEIIEPAAYGIEMLAVAIILVAVIHAILLGAIQWKRKMGDPYESVRRGIGKGLLLGLELLIAADVIRTVALDPSIRNMAILALLVVIRTFLSWSVSVEIEGRWPWSSAK